MDPDWPEAQLTAGRSIESIAREVGKHPSTISYWLKKHGLRSRYAQLHARRGAARCRASNSKR
jgi:IS30 family transposase